VSHKRVLPCCMCLWHYVAVPCVAHTCVTCDIVAPPVCNAVFALSAPRLCVDRCKSPMLCVALPSRHVPCVHCHHHAMCCAKKPGRPVLCVSRANSCAVCACQAPVPVVVPHTATCHVLHHSHPCCVTPPIAVLCVALTGAGRGPAHPMMCHVLHHSSLAVCNAAIDVMCVSHQLLPVAGVVPPLGNVHVLCRPLPMLWVAPHIARAVCCAANCPMPVCQAAHHHAMWSLPTAGAVCCVPITHAMC